MNTPNSVQRKGFSRSPMGPTVHEISGKERTRTHQSPKSLARLYIQRPSIPINVNLIQSSKRPYMPMHSKESQPQIVLTVNGSSIATADQTHGRGIDLMMIKALILTILTKFHAGYFRISLSLSSQALLWKSLGEPTNDSYAFCRILPILPSTAFIVLWSFALFTLVTLSILYILKCLLHFDAIKEEFLHPVGVNYLFAPWISWLLLLQSSPLFTPKSIHYLVLWWIFVIPIVALDVKIYGQWFIKGKRFLSTVANPTSQISVIGNLVGARAAAQMGWKESAIFLFSLGMTHYLVLFVTLYQRLPSGNSLPAKLRPVLFLFFAAPSMASLAWDSISGSFNNSSKMLFFLSLFLFISLVTRDHSTYSDITLSMNNHQI